jgi:pyruvate/2-oxoglutarate dehydrogenase complex dihydrolipoamide dehydrogenase (E3) component
VVEAARALGRDDPEAVALVLARLRAEGVTIHEGAAVTAVSGQAGAVRVDTAQGQSVAGTHLLIAIGRQPVVDGLGLDLAGVDHGPGGIAVDAGLRSSNRRIFAIGDVTGGAQFTHVAGYQAGVIVRSMLFGLRARGRSDHIPRVTYTDPELAQVGLTEAEARKIHGARLTIVRADFAHNDRAIATGQAQGFAKVMVVRGRPVGAVIVGPQAGELIQVWALALAARLKISAVAGMISPYPTLGEINKRVAGAYFAPRLFESPWVKRVVRFVQRLP